MMQDRLRYLLSVYLDGRLTEDQRRELLALLEEEQAAKHLKEMLGDDWSLEGELPFTQGRIVEGVLKRIRPVRRMGGFRRWGWAAAAVLLLCSGAYLWTLRKPAPLAKQTRPVDILPGGDKAVLTLADGKQVELDSAANGTIAQQGNVQVVKLANGKINYKGGVAGFGPDAGSMMNTLRTPRGGQYRLVLPDGTQAWLNAASSISYPAAFTTNERRVRISGEVYFEVAVDKAKPFVAEASDGSLVQVLGTSFDIDSYLDEGVVKTTLLTGKVRVSAGSGATMVAPGEQAQESPDKLTLVDKVDLEKVMAWKNGFFDFQDATLEEVMRQLERWYDIKVEYPKGIPAGQFEGQISRNINLADLLKILARADVKFKIEEGRRLLVLP